MSYRHRMIITQQTDGDGTPLHQHSVLLYHGKEWTFHRAADYPSLAEQKIFMYLHQYYINLNLKHIQQLKITQKWKIEIMYLRSCLLLLWSKRVKSKLDMILTFRPHHLYICTMYPLGICSNIILILNPFRTIATFNFVN